MVELWRRLWFFGCVCGAVLLALTASLSPLVLVSPVDFAREHEKEGSYMGIRVPSEEARRLRSLPLEAYVAEKTRGKLVTVSGQAWQELFTAVSSVGQSKPVAEKWQQRLPADKYPAKSLF